MEALLLASFLIPFFNRYYEYRKQQEALHEAWVKKKEERDARIARGEKVEPLEPDPTAVEEVGLLGFLKFLVIFIAIIALAGKFVTGSYTWEYSANIKRLFPVSFTLFFVSVPLREVGSTPTHRHVGWFMPGCSLV